MRSFYRPSAKRIYHQSLGWKSNNASYNLEYVTNYDHYLHSVAMKLNSRNPPKITPEQAGEIKALNGIEHYADVASKYGLSHQSVRNIWSSRNWKHI